MNQRITQELVYFFSGLSFYTRLPCPAWVGYSAHNLNKSRKYLPLIGMVIGAVAASVFWLCHYVLPISISLLLSMVATVYLTGAFHEDGLADCADGFGGGWDKAQILSIMKDSRLGAYGAISLIFMLALKFLLLWELQAVSVTLLLLALLAGHSLSRLMPSLIMQAYAYVSAVATSKSTPVTSVRLSVPELLWSVFPIALLLMLVLLLGSWSFLLSIVLSILPMLLMTGLLARGFQQRIGGYTGDCLGAVQQISEGIFYLSLIILSGF